MKTQRLRDPIHDLIVFEQGKPIDEFAWQLLDTPEMQRLRKIRQLGLSELVFPGATHTRFAHSVGVFNNARKLIEVIRKDRGATNQIREWTVLIAALLHDIGHGPFSHAFEVARKAAAAGRKESFFQKHEKWSARLIVNPNGRLIELIGEETANSVAALIAAEDPQDIYHAVVSSSFDADRMDYLVRDRYMTGAKSGAFDMEWLIDNLTTADVRFSQDDDQEEQPTSTFVFKMKGRQAAEDFLLARYRLYSQIYLHKTTRGFEQIVAALFCYLAQPEVDPEKCGLNLEHPLVRFLRAPEEESFSHINPVKFADFMRLDDFTTWAAIEIISKSADVYARQLASRLYWREPLAVIDVTERFGGNASDAIQLDAERRLENHFISRKGKTVFVDRAKLNLYSRIGSEVTKEHKKVRVLAPNLQPVEIVDFPDTIIGKKLREEHFVTRYYFLSEDDKKEAEKVLEGK